MASGAPRLDGPRRGSAGTPQVALLVETSLASGRDILAGITQYVRVHGPWGLYHEARSLEQGLPGWLQAWKGDGIIVRAQNREIADAVKATGLPVIDVLGVVPEAGLPLVHVDDLLIAQMAVEHLLEQGFHHFGYFGIRGENWSESRRDGLLRALGRAANRATLLEVPRSDFFRAPWEFQQEDLVDWLLALPKPVGIMVASDQLGPPLLEACHRAGLAVPDQVAVVGVDNDDTLCNVCNPSLSSVDASHREVGYRAAELLGRLLHGAPVPAGPILIRPMGLVARRSSDGTATEDPHVALALRLIREHACEGWSAARVAEQIPVSRSVLQRRFRRETGRSLQEEIIRTRLRHARKLLAETDLPLMDVAVASGFKHQEYLGMIFRTSLGKTPAAYRREIRGPRVRHG